MEYVFNLNITKKQADIALRRFIRRNLGWGMLIAVVLCVSYLIYDLGRDFGSHLSPLTIAVITLLIVPSFNELSFLLSHQFFAVSDLLYNTLR